MYPQFFSVTSNTTPPSSLRVMEVKVDEVMLKESSESVLMERSGVDVSAKDSNWTELSESFPSSAAMSGCSNIADLSAINLMFIRVRVEEARVKREVSNGVTVFVV